MEVSWPQHPIRIPLGMLLLAALAACGGGGSKPVPTVTLTANPTTVNSGATTQLTWSSTNATTCTASGAWSGTKETNGTEASPTITAASTFTLSCTGDGGTRQASANVVLPPAPTVTLQGQVMYETVPFGPQGTGLNYAGLMYVPLRPTVLVEAVDATTHMVLASGRFSQNYSLDVPGVTNMKLRVTATTTRQAPDPLPHWQVSVRDLDLDTGAPLGPVYAYTGPQFDSAAGGTHDLQIPSGWSIAGTLIGERSSAPFAVLDAIQTGLLRVLSVLPNADFPALTVDWGPNNAGGVTFYTRDGAGRRIVLSAEVNADTDEYDAGVILHEFGHYIDDAFSRSDNIGGSHSIGDLLDLRVAFGEGLATAFSAMARDNALMRDSFGTNQHNEGVFNVENDTGVDGWYSETSTQELVYDLYDNANDAGDTLSLGFQPIWDAWHGNTHSQTPAVTSLYSFMTALKQALPANGAEIDSMLADEQLTVADAYGSTETNDAGGTTDVLPVYTPIVLGGAPVVLRSTNLFGVGNKLSTHRFLKFTLVAQGNVKFDLTAAAGRDPDIQVYLQGVQKAPDMGPANESFTLPNLAPGDYVLDIYDCGNAGCNDTVVPAPTDLTISVTPN